MYIIINKTNKTSKTIEGNYPLVLVDTLLDLNQDIIIISLYSNTIKIPAGVEILNGIKDYLWTEYPLPLDMLLSYKKETF